MPQPHGALPQPGPGRGRVALAVHRRDDGVRPVPLPLLGRVVVPEHGPQLRVVVGDPVPVHGDAEAVALAQGPPRRGPAQPAVDAGPHEHVVARAPLLGERVRHQALAEPVPRDRRQEQHAVERDRAVEPELRQELRRLAVAAPPRELLGRPAPGVARVRGRAGLEQEAHALERAVARRGVQRRVAPPVGRRAARAVREVVADLVHLQHLHDERRAGRPVRRAGHEERRPPRRVRDAQVGAVLQERLEALHRRGDVAGHHAPRVRRPRDEAAAHRGQDVARAPRRAGAHGGVQRRVPVRVGLDGRAPLQQLEDAVRPVVRARVEEGRPPALVRAAQAAVVARPEESDLALGRGPVAREAVLVVVVGRVLVYELRVVRRQGFDRLHVGVDALEGVPPLELGDGDVAPPPLLRELGLARLEAPRAHLERRGRGGRGGLAVPVQDRPRPLEGLLGRRALRGARRLRRHAQLHPLDLLELLRGPRVGLLLLPGEAPRELGALALRAQLVLALLQLQRRRGRGGLRGRGVRGRGELQRVPRRQRDLLRLQSVGVAPRRGRLVAAPPLERLRPLRRLGGGRGLGRGELAPRPLGQGGLLRVEVVGLALRLGLLGAPARLELLAPRRRLGLGGRLGRREVAGPRLGLGRGGGLRVRQVLGVRRRERLLPRFQLVGGLLRGARLGLAPRLEFGPPSRGLGRGGRLGGRQVARALRLPPLALVVERLGLGPGLGLLALPPPLDLLAPARRLGRGLALGRRELLAAPLLERLAFRVELRLRAEGRGLVRSAALVQLAAPPGRRLLGLGRGPPELRVACRPLLLQLLLPPARLGVGPPLRLEQLGRPLGPLVLELALVLEGGRLGLGRGAAALLLQLPPPPLHLQLGLALRPPDLRGAVRLELPPLGVDLVLEPRRPGLDGGPLLRVLRLDLAQQRGLLRLGLGQRRLGPPPEARLELPRARHAARDAGLGRLGDASFVVQGLALRGAHPLRPPRGLRLELRQPPRLLVELRPGGVRPRARRRDGRGVLGPQRRPRRGRPLRAEAARVRVPDRGPLVARRPLRARPDLVDLPLRLLDLRALRRRAVALARGELARRLGPLLLDALLLRPDGAEVARARRRALRLGRRRSRRRGDAPPRRRRRLELVEPRRVLGRLDRLSPGGVRRPPLRPGRRPVRPARRRPRGPRRRLPLRGRCGLVPHDGRGAAPRHAHGGRWLGRRRRGERRGLVPYHGRRAAARHRDGAARRRFPVVGRAGQRRDRVAAVVRLVVVRDVIVVPRPDAEAEAERHSGLAGRWGSLDRTVRYAGRGSLQCATLGGGSRFISSVQRLAGTGASASGAAAIAKAHLAEPLPRSAHPTLYPHLIRSPHAPAHS